MKVIPTCSVKFVKIEIALKLSHYFKTFYISKMIFEIILIIVSFSHIADVNKLRVFDFFEIMQSNMSDERED